MSKQLDKLKASIQRIEAQKAELDQRIKAQARKDRNHSTGAVRMSERSMDKKKRASDHL